MEDVAAAFETILTKGRVGETYNIGTQKERTVLDVAHDIAAIFNLPADNITHVRDRAFNDQRCASLLSVPQCPCAQPVCSWRHPVTAVCYSHPMRILLATVSRAAACPPSPD